MTGPERDDTAAAPIVTAGEALDVTLAELAELDDDAAELDDDAAELDAAEVDPAQGYTEDDNGYEGEPAPFKGLCAGGPYHGRQMVSRFPKGFLLVDKATASAWLYDFNGTAFVYRPAGPLEEDGRWRAAEEGDFDVIAYDSEQVPR